ncbi:MAG: hypothetical protein V8Q42_09075 [Anaerovoracaceae bacterium]
MRRKVSQLDIDDQILVRLDFFENAKCGKKIGRILKLSQPTVCRRKEKILKTRDMLADEDDVTCPTATFIV